ncbi:hypothetical protein [Clostridium baratii]|uniref:hypothetical protein n=1 Tax=Clostridium baratii TaxID=1561 RepID=UPI002941EFA0|nr:hypothetical protein [Clostridium baratii]
MEKIIKELVELANEKCKEVLVVYNKKGELSLNYVTDRPGIPKGYIVGSIDLEIYRTYEDIEEELNSMIFEYNVENIIEDLKDDLLNKEISLNDLEYHMTKYCYSSFDSFDEELLSSKCILYMLKECNSSILNVDDYIRVDFELIDDVNEFSEMRTDEFYIKITHLSLS